MFCHLNTHAPVFPAREEEPPACLYNALAFSANTCAHGTRRNPQCSCTEHSASAASALRHIIESGLTSNAAHWLPHRSAASRRGLKYLIRWRMTAAVSSGGPTDPNTGNTDTNLGIDLGCYQCDESGTLAVHLDIVFVYLLL